MNGANLFDGTPADRQERILSLLAEGKPLSEADIQDRLDMRLPLLRADLMMLELAGKLQRAGWNRYALKEQA